MTSPMSIWVRCMWNAVVGSILATENSQNVKVAYFSGLGIAVPTVVGGVTPALERA